MACAWLSAAAMTLPTPVLAAPATFATLKQGEAVRGFRAVAIYLGDTDRPMGARFIHRKTGFTLDVLEIQSVPQGFIWVTTFPTSDMGEPHTQEHLLLGKGNKGRAVATLEPMALAHSSAFTMQWRTCYSFYTPAGVDVFFSQTERRLDALLHPDYTDEEIRREVRNFGVAGGTGGEALRLEEKGTVYNEMVSSMDQPIYRIYRAANAMVYGPGHPLSYNSGGSPEALRALRPEDIRKFHRDHYHLANMGMIASLPRGSGLEATLARMNALLNRVEPARARRPVTAEKDLPPPRPAPAGAISLVDYPHRNEQQPGAVWLAWPAERRLDSAEKALLELFLHNVAGDPTTNLYKRLIDSKTRETDLGAKSVFASVSEDVGNPVLVGFGDVPAARMNERELADLRARVQDELRRIAAWPAGSAELAAFNARLASRIVQTRRQLSKFVNTPPTFGFRGGSSDWLTQLHELNQTKGFRKSLTFKPQIAAVEKTLAADGNVWTGYLARWKLLAAEPWVLAARPRPDLIPQAQAEREERAQAELRRLQQQYGVADAQEAIRRYRADYDVATAAIDRAAAAAVPPKFVDQPPLTLDDQLDFKVTTLSGGVPLVASTFESMTSATAGVAFSLAGVSRDQLVYLAVLPALLTRVGVIDNGRPVSFEAMSERLKQEILALNATFGSNAATGRVELAVRGSGNDEREARAALEWMRLVLFHPDWRPENLSRIRDVVDQALGGARRTMQRPEESWVQGVNTAWWRQGNPLLLATESFLTQTHNLLRVHWMLKQGTGETRAAVGDFLADLAARRGSREDLKALLAALQGDAAPQLERLSAPARALAAAAARDLEATLPDIPDASLAADWNYLCLQLRRDLLAGPQQALDALDALRRGILKTGNARAFVIASGATQRSLAPGIAGLIGGLDQAPATKAALRDAPLVRERLRQRDPTAADPLFVGLLNPNAQGGVIMNSAPLAGYADVAADKLLDYLAANVYSGSGAHGVFMKTWGAGLAYSNGIRARPATGRLNYYAERTPELPQTVRFVVDELRRAGTPAPALVEYAIAEAFSETRAAAPFEARGEGMAADLADGVTPDVVARFRRNVLALRQTPDLPGELQRRMQRVYATVLPGMGDKVAGVPDGISFVIGPEKQFAAWEQYLQQAAGPGTRLHRLYPRDFWMTGE